MFTQHGWVGFEHPHELYLTLCLPTKNLVLREGNCFFAPGDENIHPRPRFPIFFVWPCIRYLCYTELSARNDAQFFPSNKEAQGATYDKDLSLSRGNSNLKAISVAITRTYKSGSTIAMVCHTLESAVDRSCGWRLLWCPWPWAWCSSCGSWCSWCSWWPWSWFLLWWLWLWLLGPCLLGMGSFTTWFDDWKDLTGTCNTQQKISKIGMEGGGVII